MFHERITELFIQESIKSTNNIQMIPNLTFETE